MVRYGKVRYDSLGTVRFARCRYHLDARSYCLDPLVCSGHSIDTLLTGQSRSSGSSLGRGGLRSRGIIPIGEMNLFSQIFFVVQLGICMNSCCQSQLEYTLSDLMG
uniref:Uncharacterized protein n=1 Tax=Picea glauca TaxID=3330 RepID=A0A101LXC2_PICGL|nr:hypothetical protein ABT39_MTgene6343 [Picea glauca]